MPRSRYFPADARVGRWLNSTSLTVTAADPEAPTTTLAGNIHTTEGTGSSTTGDTYWSVWYDDFNDTRSAAAVADDLNSTHRSTYQPLLYFRCSNEGEKLDVFITSLPVSDINDRYSITYRWGNENAGTMQLKESSTSSETAFLQSSVRLWRSKANVHNSLRLRITGYSQTVTVLYNIADLRTLPTWPNILACGG